MKEKHNKINRRNFLKTMGAAGLGSVFAGCKGKEEKEPDAVDPNAPGKTQMSKLAQVPTRKLGKTGVDVPCLCLGGNYSFLERQIILEKALEWGINCWDTAHNYAGGNSELGIGRYLSKNPQTRKKLFIISKASFAGTVADVENRLQSSLKRMNTNYIDLYFGVHFMSNPAQLTDELKQWAKNTKKRKLIRFFGFSTHSNTAQCLAAAAKLDWIDAIMTRYSFRSMQDAEMQDAVEACHKTGIGLIAIKTLGLGQRKPQRGPRAEEEKKLLRHFVKQGFTEGQAKIKVVLEDKRFSSACVGMKDINLLYSNIAAVRDNTKLTQADIEVFKEYATATCSGYCAGCAYICDSALPDAPYVSDIMRYLMYYNSYGEQERARQLFAKIPGRVKNKLLGLDYKLAETRCPQHLPIAKLVAEALSKLA
ncbi:MAG: aldo/keto reductase [Planctomycetota bacterium]|jgi:aryl-alcohol dehydrogenase-like predicted oxidoreductase